MNNANLAVVFGPNLLWGQDAAMTLCAIGPINNFIRILLDQHEEVFTQWEAAGDFNSAPRCTIASLLLPCPVPGVSLCVAKCMSIWNEWSYTERIIVGLEFIWSKLKDPWMTPCKAFTKDQIMTISFFSLMQKSCSYSVIMVLSKRKNIFRSLSRVLNQSNNTYSSCLEIVLTSANLLQFIFQRVHHN